MDTVKVDIPEQRSKKNSLSHIVAPENIIRLDRETSN